MRIGDNIVTALAVIVLFALIPLVVFWYRRIIRKERKTGMDNKEKDRIAQELARQGQLSGEQHRAEDSQREDRQRTERAAQEQRQREEQQRRDDERRREDERRRDDERSRAEQREADQRRRHTEERRQSDAQAEMQIQESTVRTLQKESGENEQARYAREKGVAYVDGNAVVADYYRNINAARQSLHDERGTAAPEQSRTPIAAAPEKGEAKDSPAMEKYKARSAALQGKVKERLAGQSKSQDKGVSREK